LNEFLAIIPECVRGCFEKSVAMRAASRDVPAWIVFKVFTRVVCSGDTGSNLVTHFDCLTCRALAEVAEMNIVRVTSRWLSLPKPTVSKNCKSVASACTFRSRLVIFKPFFVRRPHHPQARDQKPLVLNRRRCEQNVPQLFPQIIREWEITRTMPPLNM